MLCHIVYLGPMLLFFLDVILVQFHPCSLPISIKPALSTPCPTPCFALGMSLRERQKDSPDLGEVHSYKSKN